MSRNREIENSDKEDAKEEISKDSSQVQVVEREINLSLINDKLNFIISILREDK